ncbi:phenylphosphate carboxylase subunit beta [Deferrisoma camini]|uniref:phenylphosphate carboxylase subunit beta n=1 Tax=Deferrisoma camini TaxID=1035120 RepID=UPI00046CFEDB|nr:phenylphosphate carboxylase subunit beta [Deferrisoma camini]
MDLRDFIARCEEEGQLKRIGAEVDWDLELSHVAKLVEEQEGPALLFENVKDYDSPVFTGAFATTQRLALALDKPTHLSLCELTREWMKLAVDKIIPAQEVESGPVFENEYSGDDVDIFRFPSPRFFEKDGGRYIGTAVFLVTRDPETGGINLGTYRMQAQEKNRIGVQILKGKRGDRILKKYKKAGQKMPACVVIGCDPLLMLAGSAMVAKASEYDVVGSLRGEPVTVTQGKVTGLPIPADAEIVLEGWIDPDDLRPEGPFGEYTGYYTDELFHPIPKPSMVVERVYHRNKPILWATSVGRPVTDNHWMLAFVRGATLWTELEKMRIPGIESVYLPPEACGRFWAIVSVRQMYPGHASQVAAAVVASNTCTYGTKGVIVVDHDVRADDLPRVWWALATRFDPARDTQIIQRGRSTPLDPALDPDSNKLITSRILLDATVPFEWEQKPVEVALVPEVVERIKKRWKELGLDD